MATVCRLGPAVTAPGRKPAGRHGTAARDWDRERGDRWSGSAPAIEPGSQPARASMGSRRGVGAADVMPGGAAPAGAEPVSGPCCAGPTGAWGEANGSRGSTGRLARGSCDRGSAGPSRPEGGSALDAAPRRDQSCRSDGQGRRRVGEEAVRSSPEGTLAGGDSTPEVAGGTGAGCPADGAAATAAARGAARAAGAVERGAAGDGAESGAVAVKAGAVAVESGTDGPVASSNEVAAPGRPGGPCGAGARAIACSGDQMCGVSSTTSSRRPSVLTRLPKR